MSDEEGVRRTVTLYCQLLDDGRFDEWGELYTEDATFAVMGRTYEGRDAIKGFITKAQPAERRGKHLCGEPLVEFDEDVARATTDYVFIARGEGGAFAVTSIGRYHDRLARAADGRWQFAERRIVFMGDPA